MFFSNKFISYVASYIGPIQTGFLRGFQKSSGGTGVVIPVKKYHRNGKHRNPENSCRNYQPRLQSAALAAVLWQCQQCGHTNNPENNKRHCFLCHRNHQQGGRIQMTMVICCNGRHVNAGGSMPTCPGSPRTQQSGRPPPRRNRTHGPTALHRQSPTHRHHDCQHVAPLGGISTPLNNAPKITSPHKGDHPTKRGGKRKVSLLGGVLLRLSQPPLTLAHRLMQSTTMNAFVTTLILLAIGSNVEMDGDGICLGCRSQWQQGW